MKQLRQNPAGGPARLLEPFGLVRLEERLGQLEVPVAELVPGELIERARRVVEAILLDAGAGARRRPGELADRPAIDDLAGRFRVERRIQIAAVQLAKARRVP